MKHAEMTTTQFKLTAGTAAILAALCGRNARAPRRYAHALRVAAISAGMVWSAGADMCSVGIISHYVGRVSAA